MRSWCQQVVAARRVDSRRRNSSNPHRPFRPHVGTSNPINVAIAIVRATSRSELDPPLHEHDAAGADDVAVRGFQRGPPALQAVFHQWQEAFQELAGASRISLDESLK
jgi:hypothetical protein